MASKKKAPKKASFNGLKGVTAAFSNSLASAAAKLTQKDLQAAFDALNRPSQSPDYLIMSSHDMDAMRYAFTGIKAIKLKVGDWFLIGSNIYEVRGVYQNSIDARNVETNKAHKLDKFSKKIIPVPKGSPDMIRLLYANK